MFKTLIAAGILAVAVATAAVAAPTISAATSDHMPLSGPAQDNAFGADMSVVHEMLAAHDKITRTVTNLPNGIRTVTESDDPQVAKEIKDHVASMAGRLKDGRVFNVASHTLPTIFANNAKIHTQIVQTPKGVIVTQTSTDPTTVAALQAHAGEVSDLARGGMVALMRQVMANGGPMGHGGAGAVQEQMGPGMMAQMRQMMLEDSSMARDGVGTARGQLGPGMMGHAGMMNGGGSMMAQMMRQMMQNGGPMGNMHGRVPPMMQGQGPVQSGPPAQTAP